MKALVVNALGRGFDFEDVDIASPIGREGLQSLIRLMESGDPRVPDQGDAETAGLLARNAVARPSVKLAAWIVAFCTLDRDIALPQVVLDR